MSNSPHFTIARSQKTTSFQYLCNIQMVRVVGFLIRCHDIACDVEALGSTTLPLDLLMPEMPKIL